MYDIRPNLVIGFHGCDKSIANKLIADQAVIEKSEKPYDWLGHGMYFWENNLPVEYLLKEERHSPALLSR